MPIQLTCPGCNQKLSVPDNALGKKVRCEACSNVFVVEPPRAEPPTEPAAQKPAKADEAPVSDAEMKSAVTAGSAGAKAIPKPPKNKASDAEGDAKRKSSAKSNARRPDAKPAKGSAKTLIVVGMLVFGVLSIFCIGGGGLWFLYTGVRPDAAGKDVAKADEKDAAKDDHENDPEDPARPKIVNAVFEIKPPTLDQDKVTRELPGSIDQIAIGGGGRFIFLSIPQLRKIAMFDANEAKVVHYFPVGGDSVKFAASMDKLVMVFPSTKIIQRWDLTKKEREITANLQNDNVGSVLIGSASDGPIVVAGGVNQFGDGGTMSFLDLRTLKPLNIQRQNENQHGGGGPNLRISADGSVIGATGGHGIGTHVIAGNQLRTHFQHGQGAMHLAPGPDGRFIYTSNGIYTAECRPLGNQNRNVPGKFCIPAAQGNYFLSLTFGGNDPFRNQNQVPSISVHMAGEERSLITLTNIEMAEANQDRFDPRFQGDAVGRDRRYIFIPDAKMLVVIPQINTRVVVHRFDVEEALDKAGIDYLFVTSRPQLRAVRGKTYTYKIGVKSKQGTVKFKLDAGPEGMKVAGDGTVTWKVPNDQIDGEQNVILTVSDKSQQEIFHTFKVTVGEANARAAILDRKDDFEKRDPFDDKRKFDDKQAFDPFLDRKMDFKDKIDDRKPPVPVVKADLPPLPARLPITPPKLEADKVTRTLPDSITDVAIGGGGRFLICLLPKARQLAIFDANAGKVVKFLPVAGDNVRIAAGMTKLFVLFPDTKIIQRWNLTTFERELSTTIAIDEKIAGMSMGYASDGPLFVQTSRGLRSGDQLFFDAKTIKRLDLNRNALNGHVHIGDTARIRPSADGLAYGITAEHDNGHTLTIESNSMCTARSNHAGFIPGPDGKTIFGMGTFTPAGQSKAKHDRMYCVPALQGQFYLGIPFGTFHGNQERDKFPDATLYIVGDTRPLITLPDLEKATRDVFSNNNTVLRIDQRYHFIPDAQLVVSIPTTGDKLIVQKLDLDAALDKAGIDYLFVNSSPFPYAVKGENWQYTLQVKSKKGVKKFNVDAGPDKMKASPDGIVTWSVPKDFAEPTVDVIMSVADKADQEIFHTFKLTVVDQLPAGVKAEPAKALAPEKKKPPVKDEPEPVIKLPPSSVNDLTIKAPKLDKDVVTIKLPDTVSDAVVGGGGRFLLIYQRTQRKIAMFDVNEAKIVHYFPVSGDNVKFAAGLEKLVMIFPDTKIVQRWNLMTRERELTSTIDVANIANVALGSASQGPILVAGGGGRLGDTAGHSFLDLKTLKPIAVTIKGHMSRGFGSHVRVSADGTVFGIWENASPSGLQSAILHGNEINAHYEHTSTAHIVPGPDGKVLYTGNGMFTSDLRLIGSDKGRNGDGKYYLPAVHGNLYMMPNFKDEQLNPTKNGTISADICVQGETRVLAKVDELDIGAYDRTKSRWDPILDKRFFFIPQANVIVTLPIGGDRVVVHRFDVDDALAKSGIDFLFVTSRPPSQARQGTEFLYPIAAKSKKGGVAFKLESGPEGMRITKAGTVVWKIAADQPAGDVDVIVTVSDSSGQEIFHTFRVHVAATDNQRKTDEKKQ